MIVPRVIPCLLLKGEGLVKTRRFSDPHYLGDPRNIMRIFNEKEVDEIMILDIMATPQQRGPRLDIIREIVSEAFMPVAYGGGVRALEDIHQLVNLGVEKVVISSRAVEQPDFIRQAADRFGSQSIVVCLDVKRNLWGRYEIFVGGGRRNTKLAPADFARRMEEMGAGELVVNSIDRDGTMQGYDLDLLRSVAEAVTVPVIACGGAGKLADLSTAVQEGKVSAAAAGSLFVFQGPHRAVLISYPSPLALKEMFNGVAQT